MEKQLKTKGAVLKELGITSFKNLTDEIGNRLAGMVGRIKDDVRTEIFNELSNSDEIKKKVIAELSTEVVGLLKECKESNRKTIEAHKVAIDALAKTSESRPLNTQETQQLFELTSEMNKINKNFGNTIVKIFGIAGIAGVAIYGAKCLKDVAVACINKK